LRRKGLCAGALAPAAVALASIAFGGRVPAAEWTRWEVSNRVLTHLESLPLPPRLPYWNLKEACKIAGELGYGSDWHRGLWREMQPFLPTAPSSSVVSKVGCVHVHVRGSGGRERCPRCSNPIRLSHGGMFATLAGPTHNNHVTKGRRSWRNKKILNGIGGSGHGGRGAASKATTTSPSRDGEERHLLEAGQEQSARSLGYQHGIGDIRGAIPDMRAHLTGSTHGTGLPQGSPFVSQQGDCISIVTSACTASGTKVTPAARPQEECKGTCLPAQFAHTLGLKSWLCKCPST
jgi:hypothetical protein